MRVFLYTGEFIELEENIVEWQEWLEYEENFTVVEAKYKLLQEVYL